MTATLAHQPEASFERRITTAFLTISFSLALTPLVLAADPGGADQGQLQELLAKVADRSQRRMLIDEVRSGRLSIAELRRKVEPEASAKATPRLPAAASAVADGPLGATLASGGRSTTFRLLSPRALSAEVAVYAGATGGSPRTLPMAKLPSGVWAAQADGVGAGSYYEFTVDGPVGDGERFDRRHPISDPYARANVHSDGRSIVVDDAFDWGAAARFRAPTQKDAIVYEMHIKDYTQHESSGVGSASERGKYLGLTRGKDSGKVLGNLRELGVNVVELLPVHEFDNKAAPPGHINHWGYMTTHFFAPEASYATSAENAAAVKELKTAIKTLHESGIAVVLDVVFNHTAEGNEDGPVFNLKGLDNKLFYRLKDGKWYWNGTGCGNELATENAPVRQLVIDSCKYWMEHYKVDGFRFDLGAGLDRDTMIAIQGALPAGTLLFAEPWTADWNRRKWDKGDLRGTAWGLWNDGFKGAVRGLIKGQTKRDDLMTALAGSCMWFAATPSQTVNYVECHDNDTLDDHVGHDVKKNHLAAVAVLTAQGVPMLHEGQEFRKNKKGNDNSYDQDNDVNWIDWTLKEKNRATFDFYRGLIALRKKNVAFRSAGCLSDSTVKWLKPGNEQAVGYLLNAPGAEADYLVLLNGDPGQWVGFDLPRPGDWEIVCNGEKAVAEGHLGTARGDYRVPPSCGVILRAPGRD